MATTVLTIAGNAILPGGGGALVGALLGAAIDSYIFRPDDQEGPKLEDFKFQGMQEGTPIVRPFGRRVRVPCQILYRSLLFETKNTISQNGKGSGSGGDFIEYTYSTNVAVACGRGPVENIRRIWANGNVIYNAYPDINVATQKVWGIAQQGIGVYNTNTGWKRTDTVTIYFTGDPENKDLRNIVEPNQEPGTTGATTAIPYTGPTLTVQRLASGPLGTPDLTWGNNFVDIRGYEVTLDPEGSGTIVIRRTVSWQEGDTPPAFTFVSFGTPNVGMSATEGWLKVFQDQPSFSPKVADNFRFYRGTEDQPVDPYFEALVGIGEWPAHRGTVWFGIENLQLSNFGNTLPQFTAEVEVSRNMTVKDCIDSLMKDAGVGIDQYDASIFDSIQLDGYLVRDVQTPLEAIQRIMIAYEVMAYEDQDGRIVFFFRKDAERVSVKSKDLSARFENADSPRPVSIKDSNPADTLPTQVIVTYADYDRDDNQGTRLYRRKTVPNTVTSKLNIPLTISSTQAGDLAIRSLYQAIANNQEVDLSLPPSMIPYIREGVLLKVPLVTQQVSGYGLVYEDSSGRRTTIRNTTAVLNYSHVSYVDHTGAAQHFNNIPGVSPPTGGVPYKDYNNNTVFIGYEELQENVTTQIYVLVTSVDRGEGYVLKVSGVIEQPHLFNLTLGEAEALAPLANIQAPLYTSTYGQHKSLFPSTVNSVFFNAPALLDEHLKTPGFYWATSVTDPGNRFTGATLFESIDGGINYRKIDRVTSAGTIGTLISELPPHSGSTIDYTNSIEVLFADSDHYSITERELFNGVNRYLIGNEIVGVQDVQPLGNRRYLFSKLIRGLRATNTAGQQPDATIVRLDSPGVNFYPLQSASIGMQRYYKVVSRGQNIDDVAPVVITPNGANVRPLAPSHIIAVRDKFGNVVITWNRRTRANIRTFGPQAAPLLEPWEKYDVEIWDHSWSNVLRTKKVTGDDVTTVTYTAAEQTADGKDPLNPKPVNVRIYQRSEFLFRGYPATVTIDLTKTEYEEEPL